MNERKEEIVNTLTHAIGFGLACAGAVLVIIQSTHNGARAITAAAVFGSCLILLYLASTLYHAFSFTKLKPLFRKFDHMAIYLLIAGTYTPFALVGLKGAW